MRATGIKRALPGFSFAAAVLVLLSPWTAASPFSALLSLWVVKFLAPLFSGGMSITFMKFSPLVIIFPLFGSVIFAVPLLGLQRVVSNSCLNHYCNGAAIGVFLVGTGGALELALTRSAAWDPWQGLELVFVVAFGLLLVRCGLAITRIPQTSFVSVKPLGWLIFSVGICLSSFILLPLGVIGSIILYFELGMTFLRTLRLD